MSHQLLLLPQCLPPSWAGVAPTATTTSRVPELAAAGNVSPTVTVTVTITILVAAGTGVPALHLSSPSCGRHVWGRSAASAAARGEHHTRGNRHLRVADGRGVHGTGWEAVHDGHPTLMSRTLMSHTTVTTIPSSAPASAPPPVFCSGVRVGIPAPGVSVRGRWAGGWVAIAVPVGLGSVAALVGSGVHRRSCRCVVDGRLGIGVAVVGVEARVGLRVAVAVAVALGGGRRCGSGLLLVPVEIEMGEGMVLMCAVLDKKGSSGRLLLVPGMTDVALV